MESTSMIDVKGEKCWGDKHSYLWNEWMLLQECQMQWEGYKILNIAKYA